MAMLLRSNGDREIITPANGSSFTLAELQTLVGGYIELAPTNDGMLMIVDEEGKLKGKPPNPHATLRYKYARHSGIVGEALIGTEEEFGGTGDDDEDYGVPQLSA